MKEDTSLRPKAAANDPPLRVDGDNGGAISDLVAGDRPNHLDLVAGGRPNHFDLVADDSAAPPLVTGGSAAAPLAALPLVTASLSGTSLREEVLAILAAASLGKEKEL